MAKLIGTEIHGTRIDRYWLHSGDDGKDRITVTSTEDAEPLLEANKRLYNDAPGRFEKKGEMRLVARFTATAIEAICKLNKISLREMILGKSDRSQALWNKLLNNPDLRGFRTAPGRVDMRTK